MKRGLFLCVLLAGCVRGGFEARALDRGATDRPADRVEDRSRLELRVDSSPRDLAAELGPGDGSGRELAADLGGDRARDTSKGESSVSFTLAVTPPSWATTLRGRQAFHAFAVLPDGGSLEITEQVSWQSTSPSILLVDDAPGSKGRAVALGVGSASIKASHPAAMASVLIPVKVEPATLLVQWGGWQVGGHGTYDPKSGLLLKTLSLDAKARDYRGLWAMPGGFLTVGIDPYTGFDFAEYLQNDGSTAQKPLLLTGAPAGSGMQAVTRTRDGVFFAVPQYYANAVYLFDKTGAHVGSFGKGELSQPFRAVELDDGRLVVSSFADGRLVAFPRTPGGFGAGSTLVSGLQGPFGLDLCRQSQTILVSELNLQQVQTCTTAGVCKVLVTHKLTQPRVLQLDLNSGDCAFFLGWRDTSVNRIARFKADGSLDKQDFATMPAGIANLFAIEFLVPEEGL